MKTMITRGIVVVLSLTLFTCSQKSDSNFVQPPRIVTADRIVRIPMYPITTTEGRERLSREIGSLAMSPGGEDEQPFGPEGFDVLGDGGFVITDPLQQRLAIFDSVGHYQKSLPLGLAALSVEIVDGGFEVRVASTGDSVQFDASGNRQPAATRGVEMHKRVGKGGAWLEGPRHGRVIVPSQSDDRPADTLHVDYDDTASSMVSLRSLGVDQGGNIFVAIENASGGAVISTRTLIRKYSPQGEVLCEILTPAGEWYITPNEPFRARGDCVYELRPQEDQIEILVWRTAVTR